MERDVQRWREKQRTQEMEYGRGWAEQSRAEQNRAEQSRIEQSRAEQSRAEQSRAEQSRVAANSGREEREGNFSPHRPTEMGLLGVSSRRSPCLAATAANSARKYAKFCCAQNRHPTPTMQRVGLGWLEIRYTHHIVFSISLPLSFALSLSLFLSLSLSLPLFRALSLSLSFYLFFLSISFFSFLSFQPRAAAEVP